MNLDPEPEVMRRLGYRAVDLAVEHLAALGDKRVARLPRAEVLAPLLEEPLPLAPRALELSLERYFKELLPHATLVNHPRFFGYIPCPGSYVSALGEWLAASTNCFVGSWLGGAVMTQMELQVLSWLRQALALPAGYEGILTSGGSMANLCGLAAARSRLDDLGDLQRASVYLSEEGHYSLAKAARTLGFREENIRQVPMDSGQRMRADAAGELIRQDRQAGYLPLALCATLGTTSTGAIDPLAALAGLCAEEGVWFHVDGAYGAAVCLLEEKRSKGDLASIAQADSLTLDPHKWLYSTFECGCILTRHVDSLRQAFTSDATYLQDIPREEVNFFERGLELSRGNRAVKLWLLFRAVGLDAIKDAIREDLRLCKLARDLLASDPRIEIVTEPQLSIFSFAVEGGDEVGRRLTDRILEDGHLMLSSSRVHGRFVLRLCCVNHRTTEADVRSSVKKILELLGQLEG